jgi:methylglutamate dehydrogenase subunit D
MSDHVSPLGAEFKPGRYGALSGEPCVVLGEGQFDFVAEVAAFDQSKAEVTRLVSDALKKTGDGHSFQIAWNRWIVAGPAALRDAIGRKADDSRASLIDQTHGRTALTINGPRTEWVLAKLFAIDFRPKAFPASTGLATLHHDISAWIYRDTADGFILFVPRSFTRSFWHTLRRSAEEVGYRIG